MVRSEGEPLREVILCSPDEEYFKAGESIAHNIPGLADRDKTRRQHGRLKTILQDFGCRVVDVRELPGHPNSVFTRDAALCTPDGYVRLRMGLPSRRGEDNWMAGILAGRGEVEAGEIRSPGTVEGGDVILLSDVAFIGISDRTNREGARQLGRILSPMGYEIRTVAVPRPHLHLGGIMSAIGPGNILCCTDLFPSGFFKGFTTTETGDTGPSRANVICLKEGEIIANSAENMETITILEKNGINVHRLDLSEFRKGSGGPTCLILPQSRGASVPGGYFDKAKKIGNH